MLGKVFITTGKKIAAKAQFITSSSRACTISYTNWHAKILSFFYIVPFNGSVERQDDDIGRL